MPINGTHSGGTHSVPRIAPPHDAVEHFRAFVEIVRLLRVACPWDRKQTHASLTPLLIEETYEAVEAAQTQNYTELAKELGDILLHVVMNAVIAEESGAFSLESIIKREMDKLIHRHPHVFGAISSAHTAAETTIISSEASSSEVSNSGSAAMDVITADEVQSNWEQLKMREGRMSALEGVPKHLPALLRSQRTQEKAARVGFDWSAASDVWRKVEEEFAELKMELSSAGLIADGQADAQKHSEVHPAEPQPTDKGDKATKSRYNQARVEEEFGDLLFSLVNAARFFALDAEQTLQNATNKFIQRFQTMERLAREVYPAQTNFAALSLEEMDVLWNKAKTQEHASSAHTA